jgi:hypothetical protein
MDSVTHLQRLLEDTNRRVLIRPLPPGQSIDREIIKLRKRLQDGAAFAPHNRQEEAVRRFWIHQKLDSFKDTYLVAFGLTLPFSEQRMRIIENRDRFVRVVAAVNTFLPVARQYRRCYQGLLHCYFDYDPAAGATPHEGAENWKSLRTYLARYIDRILSGTSNPGWATFLQQHANLLADEPCSRYGMSLLEGNRKEVDDLRAVLHIPDASWFTRELYLGQVQAAVAQPDAEFLQLVPEILKMLPEHAGILDRGLIALLDRLAQIQAPPIVPALRNATVERWGNPWLLANAPSWGRVNPAAKDLVTEWLKLEFIQAFFELLSKDGTGNPRRLKFWKKYVNAIDDIHFSLGAQARGNQRADFKNLLKRMEGRKVPLNHQSSNAFVMRMGPLVVVEFSEHGNASYFYRSAAAPFELDPRKPVQMGVDYPNSLKNSQHELKFSHHDGAEVWEAKLARTLAGYGLQPDDTRDQRRTNTPPAATPPTPRPAVRTPASGIGAGYRTGPYSLTALKGFCIHHRLPPPDDRTNLGGNMRVVTDDHNVEVNEILLRWGFRYKNDKRFWWKAR